MQSANRIRTLWITPLSYERAAPKEGAAETVTAGTARADGQHHTRRIRGGQSDGGRKARKHAESACFATIGRKGRRVMAMRLRGRGPACDIASGFVSHVRDTTR